MSEPNKRTWAEVIEALRHDYTLTIRDVCQLLKASRPWVNRYIRPHVESIYLNSGKRGDYSVGPNWVRMASQELERDMTESTWLHQKQLYELLARSIVSVTKQTKSVPLVYLMDPSVRDQYIQERDEIIKRAEAAKTDKEFARLEAEFATLPGKFIDEDGLELLGHHCAITQRGKVDRVDVPYPGEMNPALWQAAHDLKTYGDTDEDIYRRLFRDGCIRLELAIPDADGVVGQKIYYVPDPEYIKDEWDDRSLIIPEPIWQAYKSKKGI